jgi:DNA-binding phage protein
MSSAGSNGILDGRANAESFLEWQKSVIDFKPFIHQGVLSVSRVARESGLNRDVFYTNPEIRDVLWPNLLHRLEKDGVLKQRVANPVQVVMREPKRSGMGDARIKQIQEENEALKAEVSELRKQLERFQGMDEVLHTTGRLPW